MRKLVVVFAFVAMAFATNGQVSLGDVARNLFNGSFDIANVELTKSEARAAVIAGEFDEAIYAYSNIIAKQSAKRAQGKQVDPELVSEYAFVLALTGAQEAAIVNIDIALNLSEPSPVMCFYLASIFKLTGFPEFSSPYESHAKVPDWLKNHSEQLIATNLAPTLIFVGNESEAAANITKCLTEQRLVQALCYSTVLTRQNPDMQIGWLLQSTVLEKMRLYEMALNSFRKGIEHSELPIPGMDEQMKYLTEKAEKNGNRGIAWKTMSTMFSAGISCSNGNFMINGRYGVYNGPLSFTANVSFSIPKHGKFTSYYGASMYYNIGKFFCGLGVGLQGSTFNLNPTIGLSFANKKRTSSFDISLSYYIPFSKDSNLTMAFSIAKTFYFKSKRGKK